MKKSISLFYCLLAGLTAFANVGLATGTSITYQNIGTNSYQVFFNYVRDCDNSQPATTISMRISSPGCNAGRTVLMNQVGVPQSIRLYCPNDPPYCAINGQEALSNYYSAVVSFSALEALCQDWYFSVALPGNSRAVMANLTGPSGSFAEAYIRLGNNLNNNSPEFPPGNYPLIISNYNIPASVSIGAAENDGDSLVYDLVPVLEGPNLPVTYQPGFSPVSPIPSVPAFQQDPNSGTLQFTPSVFVPNSPRSQGSNRYAVAFRINEYRKINGVSTLVGYIRREMVVEVEVLKAFSAPPSLANTRLNGLAFQPGLPVFLPAGQQSTLQIGASDPDPLDNINMMITPVMNTNLNFQIANNFTASPVAMLTWNPAQAEAGNTYFLQVKLEDNGCPLKNIIANTLEIRIMAPNGLKSAEEKAPLLSVFPNPGDGELIFRVGTHLGSYSRLLIFDLLGREIKRIPLSGEPNQLITWPGAKLLAPGQYVCRLAGAEGLSPALKFSRR